MRSIFWLVSLSQFTIALLIKAVALMSSTVRFMTETRLDEPVDVRLNTNVTPGLFALKMWPSGSSDVNSRITALASEDEGSKSILHSKRVIEPCFNGTSHNNV